MTEDVALRAALADQLAQAGTVTTDRVEAAFRSVPRHLFAGAVPLDVAYADRALEVKTDAAGRTVSSLSQPTMVAIMLELSAVRHGDRVLEVGAATGYDAALLRQLTGSAGAVVTVEIDDDLSALAGANLQAAGIDDVQVRCADGTVRLEGEAAFDRIIVTAGAREVAPAWTDQLVDGGRLVVPLVDETGVGSLVTIVRRGDRLDRQEGARCAFVPLR